MNQEVKILWVNALRSGNYKQTKKALADSNGYCCLGVLCDLAIQNGLSIDVKENYNLGTIQYDGNENYLPESVQQWAELLENPEAIDNSGNEEYLSILNDYHLDFEEIADLVEKNL